MPLRTKNIVRSHRQRVGETDVTRLSTTQAAEKSFATELATTTRGSADRLRSRPKRRKQRRRPDGCSCNAWSFRYGKPAPSSQLCYPLLCAGAGGHFWQESSVWLLDLGTLQRVFSHRAGCLACMVGRKFYLMYSGSRTVVRGAVPASVWFCFFYTLCRGPAK